MGAGPAHDSLPHPPRPGPLTFYRVRETSLSASYDRFLENGDRAMAALRRRMPLVPERIFREGHAVHYRIASRKAVSFKHPALAATYFLKALRLCPWLFLVDPRAAATALLILSAGRGEAILHGAVGSLMRRRMAQPAGRGSAI